MRRISPLWIIGSVLMSGIVLFLIVNFRFVTEKENVGATGEACSNRFYAAQEMFKKLGTPIKTVPSLKARDALPKGGVIILQAGVTIAGRQWQQLLSWVNAGGHLMIEVEGSDLSSSVARAADGCESGGWTSSSTNPALDEFGVFVYEENNEDLSVKTIEMEEGREPITVQFGGNRLLYADDSEPDWSAPSRDAANVMEYLSGDGRVTFVNSLQFADNWHIGASQNAAFLWGLIALSHQAPEWIWLVQFTDRPSFLLWLWQNAMLPILATGLFVLLWIWSLMPRFGPLQPELAPDRRSLKEHLRASGRLAFRRNVTLPLLEQARAQCQKSLARRAPGAELNHPEKVARIGAEITGMQSDALFEAFTREPAQMREITQIVYTLADFRRRLNSRHFTKEKS